MNVEITNVSVKMDDPAKGARLATAEVELGGVLVLRGFAVYPVGGSWGVKVVPPSRRDAKGEKEILFEAIDRGLGDAVASAIKAKYEEEKSDGSGGKGTTAKV